MLNPQNLEVQVIVSCLMWTLGAKSRSSAGTARNLESALQAIIICVIVFRIREEIKQASREAFGHNTTYPQYMFLQS